MASAVSTGPAAELRAAATLVIQQKLEVPPLSETRVGPPARREPAREPDRRAPGRRRAGDSRRGQDDRGRRRRRAAQTPVAWLTLDTPDVAQGRLLTYLEASLARVAPRRPRRRRPRALRRPRGTSRPRACWRTPSATSGSCSCSTTWSASARRASRGSSSTRCCATGTARCAWSSSAAATSRTGCRRCARRRARWPRSATSDLTFTAGEAADALAEIGKGEADAASAVEATGGWVTGVLFEAWRSAEHVPGMGGEADPLHGYLSAQMLAELDPRTATS